jgi:hypothetical protein
MACANHVGGPADTEGGGRENALSSITSKQIADEHMHTGEHQCLELFSRTVPAHTQHCCAVEQHASSVQSSYKAPVLLVCMPLAAESCPLCFAQQTGSLSHLMQSYDPNTTATIHACVDLLFKDIRHDECHSLLWVVHSAWCLAAAVP